MAVAPHLQPGPHQESAPALSLGAVALVCLLAIGFVAAVPWITLVGRAGDPVGGYLPPGPLALLAVTCWVIAPLVRRWSRRSEQVVRAGLLFYALTVSIGGFATTFTVLQIPQVIPSLKYFTTPTNRFEEEAIPAVAETLIITNQVAARGRGCTHRWRAAAALGWSPLSAGDRRTMLGIFRRR